MCFAFLIREVVWFDFIFCEMCGEIGQNKLGAEESGCVAQWNVADASTSSQSGAWCWQRLSLCNFFLAKSSSFNPASVLSHTHASKTSERDGRGWGSGGRVFGGGYFTFMLIFHSKLRFCTIYTALIVFSVYKEDENNFLYYQT